MTAAARFGSGGRTLARLERILVMVPWLLEHPHADLDEVAGRFGVPTAALVDDLDVLGYCGVPGYGGGDLVEVAIVGNEVTVRMADFFRRPLRLSLREVLTLTLAARVTVDLTGSPELRSGLEKLQRLLGAPAGTGLAIEVAGPGDEHLPILRAAVEAGEVVHLTYRSASKAEITERDVEPWALTGMRGAWYLQGWCRLAGAARDFRLDRIKAVLTTGQRALGNRPRQAPEPVYEPGPDDLTVVLDLRRPAWWVSEWLVCDRAEERGGIRRIAFRTPELEWVARLVLRLGSAVVAHEPAALAGRVRTLAAQTLQRYR